MSGLLNKLTHRHAAPVAGTAPLNTSTGLVQQQPSLYKPTTLNTSGGMMNTGSNVLNTTTPLNTSIGLNNSNGLNTMNSSTTIQQPIQHATTHVAAPIIQETVRNDRVIEVQPVLHREVDQNVVHHIEKHYTETAPSMGGVVERPALVQQAIHTNVINEIQPIIHRERVVPVLEHSEQHLSQHIIQPTIHTHEVVYERGTFNIQQQNMMGMGMQQQTMGMGMQQPNMMGMQQPNMMGMQQPNMMGMGMQQQTMMGHSYQGLNFPYSNASSHPTYGYQRLPRDRKAERFELKAAEWERRGNMLKANKNREKALRLRQKSMPGYVAQPRPQNYHMDRANLFDQKALQYQQWGMMPQSQRYQQRSARLRGKYNLQPINNNLYSQQGQSLLPQGFKGQNLYTQQGQTLMPQDKLMQQQQFNQPRVFSAAR